MSPMRLPDFIVVGPPRTATTWLDSVLRGHAGLPAEVKETHFFARNYGRGLDWHVRHFKDADPDRKLGEVCAAYFENPEARERIARHIPDCRIICTLRDPVERLHSYYKLMRQGGKTELSFEQTVRERPKLLQFSRYATLLRQWRGQFGDANVLAVLNDDLTADPQSYLDQITRFIGIAPVALEGEAAGRSRRNAIQRAPRSAALARGARRLRSWMGANRLYRARSLLGRAGLWRFCSGGGEPFPPMHPETRSWLQEQLRPEIEQLEALLGRDLSGWKGLPLEAERPRDALAAEPSLARASEPSVARQIQKLAPASR